MEQKIILDEKSFKALSADSRISILKNLGERRKTLTELSQKLNLGGSTIKEHCEILIQAGLIRQVDEGRKWKYYELTNTGKQIIQPSLMEEVKVLIILCLATLVVGGFMFLILNSTMMQGTATQERTFNSEGAEYESIAKSTAASDDLNKNNGFVPSNEETNGKNMNIDYGLITAGLAGTIIAGLVLGLVFFKKNCCKKTN
jgi:DNA-binding transcriptional ArsR family regulator